MKWLALLVAFFLLIATSASAVEFGPDSANISNPYFPGKIGDWGFYQGVSNSTINYQFLYLNAVGTEKVSGAQINGTVFNNVNCLKLHVVETDDPEDNEHEVITIYFAQDTDGNVWPLKIYSYMEDSSSLLGGPYFKSMFMPAVPAVGLRAGLKTPEDAKNYCEITEVGIPSRTTVFGTTYNNCIKVNCYENDPADIDVEYYCRDVGIVSLSNLDDPGVFLDLKDYGSAALKKGVVVIPMIE